MDHTSTGAAPVKTGKADRRADLPFLVITLTLLGVGVVMVLSASFASAYYDLQGETGHNPVYFFSRQAIFAAAGVCVMLIASRIPMRVYRACALPLLLVSVASLAAVLVIGTVVNGARRWISLGFTTFQPSEITKIAIILYFSALICKYKDRMRTFRYGIAPFAAILAVVSALLVLEPHFSATIIILAIGASMLFLGGVRLHWFIGAAGVLLVGAVAAVLFVPYVAARVASFRDPFSDLTGDGWQIVQSLYAIGSGGLFGVGLGQGTPEKIPAYYNDFIFAVVCEQLGQAFGVLLLAVYVLLILRGVTVVARARRSFEMLLGCGVLAMLGIQTFMIVAGVIKMIPLTGVTMPFLSYGGSSLLSCMAMIGILHGASARAQENLEEDILCVKG